VASTALFYCLSGYCMSDKDVVGIDGYAERESIRARWDLPSMKNYLLPLRKITPQLVWKHTVAPAINRAQLFPRIPGVSRTPSRPRLEVHPRASDVRHLAGRSWNSLAKVSSVRNPFTRLVSHYEFTMDKTRETPNEPARISFSSWFLANQHRLTQFYRENTEIDGANVVDHFLRVEFLLQDFDALLVTLNLDPLPSREILAGRPLRSSRRSRPDISAYYEQCPQAYEYVNSNFRDVLGRFSYSLPIS